MATVARGFPAFNKLIEVAGGATGTTLTATGLAADDTIVGAIALATRTTELATNGADLTAEATIAAANDVRFSTTVTTSMRVLLFIYDKSAANAA